MSITRLLGRRPTAERPVTRAKRELRPDVDHVERRVVLSSVTHLPAVTINTNTHIGGITDVDITGAESATVNVRNTGSVRTDVDAAAADLVLNDYSSAAPATSIRYRGPGEGTFNAHVTDDFAGLTTVNQQGGNSRIRSVHDFAPDRTVDSQGAWYNTVRLDAWSAPKVDLNLNGTGRTKIDVENWATPVDDVHVQKGQLRLDSTQMFKPDLKVKANHPVGPRIAFKNFVLGGTKVRTDHLGDQSTLNINRAIAPKLAANVAFPRGPLNLVVKDTINPVVIVDAKNITGPTAINITDTVAPQRDITVRHPRGPLNVKIDTEINPLQLIDVNGGSAPLTINSRLNAVPVTNFNVTGAKAPVGFESNTTVAPYTGIDVRGHRAALRVDGGVNGHATTNASIHRPHLTRFAVTTHVVPSQKVSVDIDRHPGQRPEVTVNVNRTFNVYTVIRAIGSRLRW